MLKPIPKSLHTVTVLRRIARLVVHDQLDDSLSPAEAVQETLRLLGYDEIGQDLHGLALKATEMLEREGAWG